MSKQIPFILPIFNPGYYAIVNDEGEYLDKVHLIRIPSKQNIRYRFNDDMDLVDMWERKYKKKPMNTIKIKENSINNREMLVQRVELEGSDRADLVHITVRENNKKKSEFKLSQQQVLDVRNALLENVVKIDDSWKKDVMKLDFGVDVLIIIILLKNPDYLICANDLIELGVKQMTANKALKSMEKKGNLRSKGKISRRNYYTCTVSRERLANEFKVFGE